MAKDFAKKFYASDAWKACRSGFIAKRMAIDGGMCEVCHEHPGMIVHHIEHLSPRNIHNPEITLNEDNLQYVCKHCHDVIHGYCGQEARPSRVWFDAAGNAHEIRPH